MKIAVDGTACIGKTTFLKNLQSISLPVVVGDYYEDCKKFPILLDKDNNKYLQNLYTFYVTNKSIDGHIHNRSPISNIIYDWIIRILKKEFSLDCGLMMVHKYKELLKPNGWFIIIWVTEEDEEIVVERMRNRNNGVDILTSEYVWVQNCMFREISKVFNFPLFIKSGMANNLHIETLSMIIPIIRNTPIVYQIGEKEIKTTHVNDAGIDLTVNDLRVVLRPGNINRISLVERVYIPRGYMGFIKERSSAAQKFGLCIVGGIIDAEYLGPLSIMVTVTKESVVSFGENVAQIIFLPIVVGSLCGIEPVGFASSRGQNGWGSTGGYRDEQEKKKSDFATVFGKIM